MATKTLRRGTNEAGSRRAQTPSKNAIDRRPGLMLAAEVEGTTPLIQHNFAQKSVEEMLRKHMGLTVERAKKSPADDVERATIYNTEGRVCLPPVAFKSAMLSAAGQVRGLKKTQLRTQLFVAGGSVPITFDAMVPRMDMTRLSGMTKTPDVRFRPSFVGWRARFIVEYGDQINASSLVDLLYRAGKVGVGEWRPERNGTFGTFTIGRFIDDKDEIAEIDSECRPILRPLVTPEWAMDMQIDSEMLRRAFGDAADTAAQASEGEDVAVATKRRRTA